MPDHAEFVICDQVIDATHHLAGSSKGIDDRAAELEEEACPRCEMIRRLAPLQVRRERESLPPITGTPEDVAEAEGLREQLIAVLQADREVTTLKVLDHNPSHALAMRERETGFIRRLIAQTSASWWIAHRETRMPELREELSSQVA